MPDAVRFAQSLACFPLITDIAEAQIWRRRGREARPIITAHPSGVREGAHLTIKGLEAGLPNSG